MCREGGGGQGRGRGPPAAPRHLRVQAQATSTGVLLWREGWGEEGSSPGCGLGCHSGVHPAHAAGHRHPSPLYNEHSFCASLASWLWGQEGSGGLGAPMCAGTVGCPVMGTRGTHWNLPGKGSLQETSRSRGHGGGGGNTAWAANLTIISAVSSCHLGSGNSGQRQAAAGSGVRGRGRKPSVTRRACPSHTWHPLLCAWVLGWPCPCWDV